MGQKITKRLLEMQEKYEVIGDIRGPGLFIGVELVKNKETREPFTELTEEIVLIAHLCHPAPGANDNASGSATLAEIACQINTMVTNGLIPPPQRTIRFLWVPEFSGTVPWLKLYDKQRDKRTIHAALNLDMVGESPARIGTPLTIYGQSMSTPSLLTPFIQHVCELVANQKPKFSPDGRQYTLNYRMAPFCHRYFIPLVDGSGCSSFVVHLCNLGSCILCHQSGTHKSNFDAGRLKCPL